VQKNGTATFNLGPDGTPSGNANLATEAVAILLFEKALAEAQASKKPQVRKVETVARRFHTSLKLEHLSSEKSFKKMADAFTAIKKKFANLLVASVADDKSKQRQAFAESDYSKPSKIEGQLFERFKVFFEAVSFWLK
jgi:hypothetical protein